MNKLRESELTRIGAFQPEEFGLTGGILWNGAEAAIAGYVQKLPNGDLFGELRPLQTSVIPYVDELEIMAMQTDLTSRGKPADWRTAVLACYEAQQVLKRTIIAELRERGVDPEALSPEAQQFANWLDGFDLSDLK